MKSPYQQALKNNMEKEIIQEYISRTESNKYEVISKLGDGMFSEVFKCKELSTGNYFAIKKVQKSFLLRHNLRNQFMKEIKIHSTLDHPNIVKLYKVFEDVKNMFLVMELCGNGTLNSIIEQRKKLSILEAKYYLKNLVEGLNYIHSKNIIHRDLKPANLVISDNMELKIADFGLASYIRGQQRRGTFCGTPFFIAPEIVKRDKRGHSYEADYWSCGVILYHMIYGQCPFISDNVDEVYRLIKENEYIIDPMVDKNANDLIQRLLVTSFENRASYQEIMNSNFMKFSENLPETLPLNTLMQDPTMSFLTKYSDHLTPQQQQEIQKNFQNNVYKKNDSQMNTNLSDKNENYEYSYVKKWVNYSEKFGIGFILNNGIIGILFNDKSKIVLSNFGITFHYFNSKSKSYNTFNILNYPKELDKKRKILDHLIKHLKTTKQLFPIHENMPDNFEYVKNYKITKYAVLLILSSDVYQMIFKDGTEIHIVPKINDKRIVIFIDKKRERQRFEGEVTNHFVLQRLEYIQQELKDLKFQKDDNQFKGSSKSESTL